MSGDNPLRPDHDNPWLPEEKCFKAAFLKCDGYQAEDCQHETFDLG